MWHPLPISESLTTRTLEGKVTQIVHERPWNRAEVNLCGMPLGFGVIPKLVFPTRNIQKRGWTLNKKVRDKNGTWKSGRRARIESAQGRIPTPFFLKIISVLFFSILKHSLCRKVKIKDYKQTFVPFILKAKYFSYPRFILFSTYK